MNESPLLIKVGGNEVDSGEFLHEFACFIRDLSQPAVIVHGGGKEITQLQQQLGIQPHYIEGVRVTDADSMAIVQMILCGTVNKRIVQALIAENIDALGISGVDRGMIRAQKMPHPAVDMGYTGEIVAVNPDALLSLLQLGITPVIAPVCAGTEHPFNVNADHVTGALAPAIQAARVIFLTHVEGVLRQGKPLRSLTRSEAESLIDEGVIHSGMIPKVRTALETLRAGAREVSITNLNGLRTHGGTIFKR